MLTVSYKAVIVKNKVIGTCKFVLSLFLGLVWVGWGKVRIDEIAPVNYNAAKIAEVMQIQR